MNSLSSTDVLISSLGIIGFMLILWVIGLFGVIGLVNNFTGLVFAIQINCL